MSVDGVGLEPVGECAESQFVKDTPLVGFQVVVRLGESPVGEVSGVIVQLELLGDSGHYGIETAHTV